MRVGSLIGLLAAASILGGPAAAAPAARKPMRVMTMMLCADQMAMMLLPPERISSITYVSLGGTATPQMDALARRLPINHGLAEEVLAQKPDLIVAGDYTTPMTRKLIKQMGIPLIEMGPAYTFPEIRAHLRLLGDAFGERARAEDLIARMDATLAELARTAPERKIVAVGWNPAGRVPGQKSVFNAVLEAAGGINNAAIPGVYERTVDLEQLLTARPQPDILLYGRSKQVRVGRQVELLQHPVLARAYGKRRLAYPQGMASCGTPYAADAAVALRKAMLAAMADGEDVR